MRATVRLASAAVLALAVAWGCHAARTTGGGGGDDGGGQTVTVTVSPAHPSLYWSQSMTFSATVTGTTNRGVDWSVSPAGGGSITSAGVYTAPAASGTFEIRAASQAAQGVVGTTTVTVSEQPAGGAPMTTAHRTTGVAPLAVFFDAVNDVARTSPKYTYAWASGVTQPADMEGAYWSWNFGDPGSGSWTTTGLPRNTATGFTAAHVYETPGTYTVTLVVTDPVSRGETTYSQTITVTDPATVFASTTRYVAAAASGGSDGNPGTQAQPWATVGKAVAAIEAGTAKRVLLNRGDTFAISSAQTISVDGPGLIGAYGTGAKPIVNVAELGGGQGFNTLGADWRIVDLDFRGPGLQSATGPAAPYPETVQGVNQLFLRLSSQNFAVGFGWGYYGVTAAGSPHDGMFLVDCDEPVRPGGYGAYLGGRRLAIVGNRLRGGQNSGGSFPGVHTLRIWQGHKAVISNNELRDVGGQRHALKLIGVEPNFPTAPETRWLSINDNVFRSSNTSQWTVSMGSQSDRADEASPITHMIFERNLFTASPSCVADIESEVSNAVVRNNVFDDSLGSDVTAILWQQRNGSVQTPRDVRIYNNTAYGAGTFLQTNSTLGNARVRNNLAATPGAAPALVAGTAGAGFLEDHNVVTGAAAATVFTAAGTGDFSLPVGSPGVDAGTSLNEVSLDFFLRARPLGAGWDAGAVESR